MAIKFPSFKKFSNADAKTRVFIVFAVVAFISITIFLILNYFSGGPTAIGPSKVATAPTALQNIPGSPTMTPEFSRAVTQANAEAARQAQLTGSSAIPILVNVPGQQSEFSPQNCILCPNEDNINVANDINDLVKSGKLSQEDANQLLDMAKRNVSVDEYAAALNELVRQGKLTPEQARNLLAKYKKQHANALTNESGKLMDSLIKSGKLPLDVANQLLALQKSNLPCVDYAAELNRLVREGKITPEVTTQLLGQYTQQKMAEQAKDGKFALQQMAKSGEITADVAKGLMDLQDRNVPVDQYETELNKLVAAGKMTPAAAAKILAQYKKQREGNCTTGILNSLVAQEEEKCAALLRSSVSAKKISAEAASSLLAMQQKNVTPELFQNALNQLVQTNKIPADESQKILQCYQHLSAVRAQAQRLSAMQGNNASLTDYANELKRAVQAGLISPAEATRLYEQYRALTAAVAGPSGIAPTVDTSIPGGADFAKLQEQALAAKPPTTEPNVVFTAPPPVVAPVAGAPPPPPPGESEQDRLARIAAIQATMENQAQQLINAWQPPIMLHREGTYAADKAKEVLAREKVIATAGGPPGGPPGSVAVIKRPLIKAGTIYYAILETAVNSDYPDTPVMAKIVTGPYAGAKLLGKLSLQKDKDRLSLNFNLMDKDEWISAKPINAFAIDPDTAKTVMASSVDYHYFKRYGAIMATSFLTGYSNAITNAGTSTTGIFGTSTTHPELSAQSKIAVGLGQVGTTIGAAIADYINTPNTVKINAGVALGILFMSEVTE